MSIIVARIFSLLSELYHFAPSSLAGAFCAIKTPSVEEYHLEWSESHAADKSPILARVSVSFMLSNRLMLFRGSESHFQHAVALLWPNETRRPRIEPYRINLMKLMQDARANRMIERTVQNVVIEDLIVENLVCASVKIKTSDITSLSNFLKGTVARIRALSFTPQSSMIKRLRLSNDGRLKVISFDENWSTAIDEIDSLLALDDFRCTAW